MVETSLLADALILASIVAYWLSNRGSKNELHDRVDDLVHGLGALAQELLKRTDQIAEVAGKMPEISLVNSDPISNILRMIHQFKTGNFEDMSGDTYKGRRDPAGRYAPALEEENNPPTPTTIDIDD